MSVNNQPITGNGTAGLVYGVGPSGSAQGVAGLGVDANATPTNIGADGTVKTTYSGTQTQTIVTDHTGAGGTQKAAVQNPFNAPAIVQAYWAVTTQSSGASTFDVGVVANATTSGDNLIDGVSGAAVDIFDSMTKNAAGNAKSSQRAGATDYVTLSLATGAATGIVGRLITVWRKI